MNIYLRKMSIKEEIINSGKEITFLEFYQKELKEKIAAEKPTLKKGDRSSYDHHRVTLKYLEEFKGKDIRFKDINYDFIQNFDYFLKRKELAINTIAGHHKNLKVYLNIAIKKDIISLSDYPYFKFKIKKEPTKRQELSTEEMERLENLDCSKDMIIDLVRDMFLFSCFTGLRYSNMQNLKMENLHYSESGISIDIIALKGNKPLFLPLYLLYEGKPEELVKKYIKEGEEFVFPRFSNQHANRMLKVVAIFSKIDKQLTYHISRHTFASNIAMRCQDPFLIKYLLSHSDIKTSMIYIHDNKELRNKQLKNIDWK